MTLEAPAAAPAPAPIETVTDQDAAAMGEVWDRLNAPEEPGAPAVEEPPEEAGEKPAAPEEEAPEPEPEPVEAPSDLPQPLRDEWATFTEPQREKVLAHSRDLNRRMAEQGRVVSAAKPVHDVLVDMARVNPAVANMSPGAIAQEVAAFYTGLQRDPVRTLATIAQNYGALDALRAALAGQPAAQQPAQPDPRRIAAAIPEMVQEQVRQALKQHEAQQAAVQVVRSVEGRPHYQDVEGDLPAFIHALKATRPELSPQDTLDAAYRLAIEARPDLKAKVQVAAIPAPAQPDPARRDAQLRARSANVPASLPTNRAPRMTEDERLADVYDRLMNT